jgi:hypothetical protein
MRLHLLSGEICRCPAHGAPSDAPALDNRGPKGTPTGAQDVHQAATGYDDVEVIET